MGLRGFLELPDRVSLRIGPAGLLIGRHKSCDLQLIDETASRRHALVRIASQGVELVTLGRQPVLVDGVPAAAIAAIAAGATLGFPGCTCRLRVEHAEDSLPVAYCLRRTSQRLQIRSTPFIVGGGSAAHVVVAGWPDDALRFQVAQSELYVELADASGATHNGVPLGLPGGAPIALAVGDELAYRGETFRIENADDGNSSTVVGALSSRASAAVLEPLPRGGRLTLTFPDGDRRVYLPGRRFQLMSALLIPPPPLAAGDYVPDSEVIAVVWTDDDEVGGRTDVNVLLTRCRQDLVAGGIAATALIERAPGGRATRVVLAAGATVRTQAE